MMSTGNRRCCAWSASMSWTPSIGPNLRSMSARTNRCTVAASSARRGSPTGVTSKPIAPRRIVSTSRIAASSSTTRTFRVTVAGSAGPARSVGGLRRGAPRPRSPCRRSLHRGSAGPARSVGGHGTDRPSSAGFARATDPGGGSEGAVEAPFDDLGGLRRRGSLLLSAALDAEVELLQPLQVRLALGEVLAEPRDLSLERENRRHRVPAHPDPRVRAVSREVRVVGGHGPRVVALLDEAVGLHELRPLPPPPRRQGGAATGEKGEEEGDDRYSHARGRSTGERLPFSSRASPGARPPWASTLPRAVAVPQAGPAPPTRPCRVR